MGAIETEAGRGIRRKIRPHFQKSELTRRIYAVLTWFGAQIGLSFATTPFVLLEIRRSLFFYQTWYFSVPIIVIVLAFVLRGSDSKSKKQS